MARLFTSAVCAMISLGTFYTLALHAVRFPIFRAAYVRAEVIETGDLRTLTVFAGVNYQNLAAALAIALAVGVISVWVPGVLWRASRGGRLPSRPRRWLNRSGSTA